MLLEHCAWGGKRLVFGQPIEFKSKVNPISGEAIVELEDLDICVFADSPHDAANQVEREVGYIWDEYVLKQMANDKASKEIARYLLSRVASYETGK